MVADLNPATIVLLLCGVSTFVFIMLLPALLELKKPKDAGPRVIADCGAFVESDIPQKIRIVNLEEDQLFDETLIKKIAEAIALLPNLEA